MGLCNAVVPDDQLESTVDEWADELIQRSPTALRLVKVAMKRHWWRRPWGAPATGRRSRTSSPCPDHGGPRPPLPGACDEHATHLGWGRAARTASNAGEGGGRV
jgi:hypothetical protein